jgi:hypothetical protein
VTRAELRAEIAKLEPWFQGIRFTDSIRVGVWDTGWLFRKHPSRAARQPNTSQNLAQRA